jgi:hypothetical protein
MSERRTIFARPPAYAHLPHRPSYTPREYMRPGVRAVEHEESNAMDANEFKAKAVNALRSYARELNGMEPAIMLAVKEGREVTNPKEIFKELSEAAEECRELLEYYGAADPLPDEARVAAMETLEAIRDCADALVLSAAIQGSCRFIRPNE